MLSEKRIANRILSIAYVIISSLAYVLEAVKGNRTIGYILSFTGVILASAVF